MSRDTNPVAAMFASAFAVVTPEQNDLVLACVQGLSQHPHAAEMLSGASSEDSFWPEPGSWQSLVRPYVVRDGMLQIPVKGILLHDFPYAVGSWATGYEYIWRAFKRGCEDFKAGNIKGIAFVINSPGGLVSGCWDAHDRMVAAKTECGVPVRAFAHEHAYSAGYGMACVADEIWVSRTGGLGSVGTVRTHVDWSKFNEKAGLTYTFVQEGECKTDGHPDKPLSESAKKRWAVQLRELNEIFISAVARSRGLNAQAVRDFEAATFSASQALSNGLADKIGALDDALADFSASLNPEEKDEQMADITQADHDAALATARTEARAEGVTEGATAGRTEGATAERTRVTAILASDEGKKRPKAALSCALRSGMDLEAATAFLADLAEETAPAAAATPAPAPTAGAPAGMFEAAMDATQQPGVQAEGSEAGADKEDPIALARSFGMAGVAAAAK